MDFLLPIWNPFIVHPLMTGLRAFANPLNEVLAAGLAGGLAIILFTIVIRVLLLPLSLAQVRSQKAMMAIQPEMKLLQQKFKGDREGLARAQMALYKERGVNPAAGCLPLLVQMPILFGMYSAMLALSTQGLTLDQVTTRQVEPGRIVYAAQRAEEPLPVNQFTLAQIQVVPQTNEPITLEIPQDLSAVTHDGTPLLATTQGLTLIPGQIPAPVNPPNTPNGSASLYLRPGGVRLPDDTLDRSVVVQVGQPYLLDLEVFAPGQTRADAAETVVTYEPAEPARLQVTAVESPPLRDLPFKSSFLWLRSLGEPDLIYLFDLGIPGLLILIMTVTSYISQRMIVMYSDDPQQQQMMKIMQWMPLMYLFFFLQTPAGLVLYWLISNLFTMVQQYFTTGLGLLAVDLKRLTGRDFQPPWAPKLAVATGPAVVAASSNGVGERRTSERADGAAKRHDSETTPAQRRRIEATHAQRPRAAASKGRRRGKR
ncbi:MAG TPA: YidC/Oxa1 family membrane protein insertase [Chloroflexota bacterium]|nr:YidC/Oxa1 family membrane protein insertase [Chloroflexota bacterium]